MQEKYGDLLENRDRKLFWHARMNIQIPEQCNELMAQSMLNEFPSSTVNIPGNQSVTVSRNTYVIHADIQNKEYQLGNPYVIFNSSFKISLCKSPDS